MHTAMLDLPLSLSKHMEASWSHKIDAFVEGAFFAQNAKAETQFWGDLRCLSREDTEPAPEEASCLSMDQSGKSRR